MNYVLIDFESASVCDLKKCGAWVYSQDVTTEVICLGYSINGGVPRLRAQEHLGYSTFAAGTPNAGLLESLIADSSFMVVAHNTGFEKAIWRNIMVPLYGWPDIPNERWHDSLAVCAQRVLPLDLDRACRVLGLQHEKDTEGSKVTRALSKPSKKGYLDFAPEKLRIVYDYNLQDIRAEVGLHERLGWLPSGERRVWELDQIINERGVKIDLPFVRAAQRVVDGASKPLAAEFKALTGFNVTQAAKVTEWVRDQGVELPDMRKETLAALLGSADEGEEEDYNTANEIDGDQIHDLPPRVRRALSIRQLIGSASIKKLARMEQCTALDGRARGLLQYHGAGPGRWAGRLVQPQNFPRGTIKMNGNAPDPEMVVAAIMTGDYEYVEGTIGPAVETVVSSLRHAIVASREKLLLAGDFAGIEARIVLSLSGQHDKTALMAAGADVYCDMAEQIYRRPIDKKKDPQERQTGKNSVLGLGFQMGATKFRDRYAKDQPFEFAQMVVDAYRKDWAPEVPKLWKGLEEAAVRTVWDRTPTEAYGVAYALEDRWLTARLPSGRKLWYFNPQPIRKEMPWSTEERPDIRQSWTYQAMKMGQWKTIDAFGGLLTENVVQGLARDVMVHAMFSAEKVGLPIVLTVHDEIVCEVEESRADPLALQQIMQDIPDWARALKVPVAAECWAGKRYKK